MKTLVIGTGNKNKVAEIIPLLEGLGLSPRPATTYGHFDPVEDGKSLEDNATIKAIAAMHLSGEWSIADDTGVFVDALDGRPGIYAARYAGEGCQFVENVKKVLKELEGVPDPKRTATFATVIAFRRPEHEVVTFRGEIKGHMLSEFRGSAGFGYDPIFVPVNGNGKTFAEMDANTKNEISHRAIAMKKCIAYLRLRLIEDGIIEEYLKRHPEIVRAHWLVEYEDLTLYLKDAENPTEPFGKNEFIPNTMTWKLFDDLEQQLLNIPEDSKDVG